jgi:hypothetical protein
MVENKSSHKKKQCHNKKVVTKCFEPIFHIKPKKPITPDTDDRIRFYAQPEVCGIPQKQTFVASIKMSEIVNFPNIPGLVKTVKNDTVYLTNTSDTDQKLLMNINFNIAIQGKGVSIFGWYVNGFIQLLINRDGAQAFEFAKSAVFDLGKGSSGYSPVKQIPITGKSTLYNFPAGKSIYFTTGFVFTDVFNATIMCNQTLNGSNTLLINDIQYT